MEAQAATSGKHTATSTSVRRPRQLLRKELMGPEVIADPEGVVAGVLLTDDDDVLRALLVHRREMEPVPSPADGQTRARSVADVSAVHMDGCERHSIDAEATELVVAGPGQSSSFTGGV